MALVIFGPWMGLWALVIALGLGGIGWVAYLAFFVGWVALSHRLIHSPIAPTWKTRVAVGAAVTWAAAPGLLLYLLAVLNPTD